MKTSIRKLFAFFAIVGTLFLGNASAQLKLSFAEEANWPPFTPNKTGKVTEGLSYDLISEVFSRINVKVDLHLFSMKRVLQLIKYGKADGVTVISKSDDRLKIISFTEPIFQKKGLIYYSKTSKPNFSWNSYADLKGLTIGLVAGNNYGDEFNDAVKKYGLKTEVVNSIELNFKKLIRDRIDVLFCVELTAKQFLKKAEYKMKIVPASKPYYVKDYHIGISKKSKAVTLVPKINDAITAMKEDGTLEKIISKYTD